MKNLNLNNYGVQEMNAEEAAEIDGGSLLSTLYQIAKNAINNTITFWV